MIRVGIIEDNAALLKNLRGLFDQAGDMKCVLALTSLLHVISEVKKSQPDVLLMDIGLPNISGIEGVKMVKENFPAVQLMMFTVFEDDEKIFDAIRHGASGYLLKKTLPEEIVSAIRDLYQGGAPMSPSIARRVLNSFRVSAAPPSEEYAFTSREKEILYGLVEGLSYKKIAERYMVSISTVRTHICHIYHKLHVNSKAEVVSKMLRKK